MQHRDSAVDSNRTDPSGRTPGYQNPYHPPDGADPDRPSLVPSTVHRVIQCHHCPPLRYRDRATGRPIRRYDWPGDALGAAFAGGPARLLDMVAGGTPHPVFLGALVIELIVVPLVLVWQSPVTGS